MSIHDQIPRHEPDAGESIGGGRFRWVLFVVGPLLILAMVAGILSVKRGFLEPVTRQNFDAARQRWRQTGPADYNMEIEVSGRQAATYYVEVRGGESQVALRNGQPLKRTPSTWTVPGMFYTVSQDVQNVEKVAAGKADETTPYLTLRGYFHPEFGFPERYLRVESVKRGANPEVSWVVTKWELVDADAK